MAKAKKGKDTKRNSFIKGISTNKNITANKALRQNAIETYFLMTYSPLPLINK